MSTVDELKEETETREMDELERLFRDQGLQVSEEFTMKTH
jgi:hypothetical protein